jgi:membrane fusion protein
MSERSPQIYREGYFAAQVNKAEGEVIIPASLSLTAYAWASILLVLAIGLFLILGEYTRKARLDGVVMPSSGLIKVVARSAGQVTERLVTEGATVKAGQALYRLSGEYFNGQGIATLASVSDSLKTAISHAGAPTCTRTGHSDFTANRCAPAHDATSG